MIVINYYHKNTEGVAIVQWLPPQYFYDFNFKKLIWFKT
jgi:hypothetical protein